MRLAVGRGELRVATRCGRFMDSAGTRPSWVHSLHAVRIKYRFCHL